MECLRARFGWGGTSATVVETVVMGPPPPERRYKLSAEGRNLRWRRSAANNVRPKNVFIEPANAHTTRVQAQNANEERAL